MKDNCCGICEYHVFSQEDGDYICVNPNSEYYSDFTNYESCCEEYEER